MGGLRISYAKSRPGIDYVMSNAIVSNVRRVSNRGGSDHQLVAFDVRAGGTLLRGAIWNVQRDRGRERREVLEDFLSRTLLRLLDFDFVMLQEAKQYHGLLRRIPGYKLIAFSRPRGAEHNVILVRNGHRVTKARTRQMSPSGWFTATGTPHAPAYATLCTIDGWLRLVNVHEVVSVDWRGGRMLGPVRRVAARAASAVQLVAIARRWSR